MVNCNGIGYENFKAGEIRAVSESTAKKLIEFGYAESFLEEMDAGNKASGNKASSTKVAKKKKASGSSVDNNPGRNDSEVKPEEEDNSDNEDETNATEE